MSDFFSQCVDRIDLAKHWKVNPRTVGNMEKLPNGLPFIEFGGKHLYHLPTSDDWLRGRMVHPNRTRRAGG
jgi:hypothetical protein